MWFLQADIAIRLLLASAVMALACFAARRFGKQGFAAKFILLADILLIAYVDLALLGFYLCYTIYTFLLTRLILTIKRFRKFWFAAFCLACALPFLYSRACVFFSALPALVMMTGIAYNMLKAIDAVYYSYYAEQKIPFLSYANFMLFFPVITAGPIFRYRDFEKSWLDPMPITAELVESCVKRLIRGAFKKMVVLTFVSLLLNRLVELGGHWYISLSVMTLSYFLLYLDMSGYADIAIALGGLMSITVPENFKRPLKAASFTQFWRNWHVSLSDWIREHIFVVLGGRRIGRKEGAVIGFCTMMFMSLWHNFSLLFALDGVYNGTILAIENLCGITTVNRRKSTRGYYVFRCIVTNALFAFNTLFYTLSSEQLSAVLRGFIRL